MSMNEPEMLNEIEQNTRAAMDAALSCIKKSVLFCIIGWAMFCFGIGLMQYNVEVLKTPIVMILGMVVVALPSITAILGGGGLRSMFNYEYVVETTYADGHKTTTSDFSGTWVSKLVLFIVVVAIGLIATPIRVISAFIKYKAAQKKLNEKPPFMSDALFPITVGLVAFVVIIILSVVVSNTIAAINSRSDYGAKEIRESLTKVEEAIPTYEFDYTVYDNKKVCNVDVSHGSDGVYTFTVSAYKATEYDPEKGAIDVQKTDDDSLIPIGVYTCAGDKWDTTDKAITEYLDGLRVEKLGNFDELRKDADNLNAQVEDGTVTLIFDKGSAHYVFEYYEDTFELIRITAELNGKTRNFIFED